MAKKKAPRKPKHKRTYAPRPNRVAAVKVGDTYGQLKVLAILPRRDASRHKLVSVIDIKTGETRTVRSSNLVNGNTTSDGTVKKERWNEMKLAAAAARGDDDMEQRHGGFVWDDQDRPDIERPKVGRESAILPPALKPAVIALAPTLSLDSPLAQQLKAEQPAVFERLRGFQQLTPDNIKRALAGDMTIRPGYSPVEGEYTPTPQKQEPAPPPLDLSELKPYLQDALQLGFVTFSKLPNNKRTINGQSVRAVLEAQQLIDGKLFLTDKGKAWLSN
jgi:hypothetical protein